MDLNTEVEIQKTDLIKFQKSLNDSFLEIFSSKGDATSELNKKQDVLGLGTNFNGLNLFIPLQDLQSLATKIKYENSIRTKSWILGFNQEHGVIYTIFNLSKVFSMLLDNKTDFELTALHANSNILYIKHNTEENFGFLLDEFKLENTTKASLLFNCKTDNEDFMSWETTSEADFKKDINKESMSVMEWELLSKIFSLAQSKEKYMNGVYPKYKYDDKYMLLSLMISKVYFDLHGNRPFFVLNVRNLTKFLVNVSPF